MDRRKAISDTMLAAQDTIYTLHIWLGLLERWREAGQAEPEDFSQACQQLKEANLGAWVEQAGGHGLEALIRAVGLTGIEIDDRSRW